MSGLQGAFFLANLFCSAVGVGVILDAAPMTARVAGLILAAAGASVVLAITTSWVSTTRRSIISVASLLGAIANVSLFVFGVLGLTVANGAGEFRMAAFSVTLSIANLYVLMTLWRSMRGSEKG